MPYALSGTFLELCDCTTVCPCWVGLSPTENRCTGAFGWAIDEGEVEGVDVAGRRVVSVSFHSGHRNTGGQEVFLFVDEDASDEQLERLTALFTGGLGGPLEELQELMGRLSAAERAAIDLTVKGRHVSVTVDHRVSGDAQSLVGADGEVMQLGHGRRSTVLGPVAEVGTSAGVRVELGRRGFDVEVKGRASMHGPFRYRYEGGPQPA